MTKQNAIYRFTPYRYCFYCNRLSIFTRPIDYGIEVEDLCPSCIIQQKLYKSISRKHLQREETFIIMGFVTISMMFGIKFGIEFVYIFLN